SVPTRIHRRGRPAGGPGGWPDGRTAGSHWVLLQWFVRGLPTPLMEPAEVGRRSVAGPGRPARGSLLAGRVVGRLAAVVGGARRRPAPGPRGPAGAPGRPGCEQLFRPKRCVPLAAHPDPEEH